MSEELEHKEVTEIKEVKKVQPSKVEIESADDSDDLVITKDEMKDALEKQRAEVRKAKKKAAELSESFEAEKAKLIADHAKALEDRENAFKDRNLMSELKAHAIKANITDVDVLALLNKSDAKFDADGNVTNASEMIEAFRTAKPHLFSSQTSVAAFTPKPKTTTAVDKPVLSMNDAERKALAARMGLRLQK